MIRESPKYIFNENIRTMPCNDRTRGQMVFCELSFGESKPIRFIVSARFLQLLRHFDGKRSIDEVLTASASDAGTFPCTAEGLEQLILTVCLPKGILLDQSQKNIQPSAADVQTKYLRFRYRVLPERLVDPIAQRLAHLFNKTTAIAICLAVSICHFSFYFVCHPRLPALAAMGGRDLCGASLLGLVAAVCHEFGHATALARYGGRGAEIGVGMYLHTPVLYTDVSDAWSLNKLQRAAVDIGGIYFQAIFASIAIVLFFFTHALVWSYTVILISVSIVSSLNPFLRMDGYWLVADLSESRTLYADCSLLFRYVTGYITGRPRPLPSFLHRLAGTTRIFLIAYTALSTVTCALLITCIAHQVLFSLMPAYPSLIRETARQFIGHSSDIFSICSGIIGMLWKTIVLVGCGLFGWRRFRDVYSQLISVSQARDRQRVSFNPTNFSRM